jgi:hypothetical protein
VSTRRPSPSRPLVRLAAALLLAAPAAAGAQITTGLRAPAPRPTAVERAQTESTVVTVRDSIARAERLDMKAWVDSAASSLERGGAPVTEMPDVPGDSLVPPATPPGAAPPAGARPATAAPTPARVPAGRDSTRRDSTGGAPAGQPPAAPREPQPPRRPPTLDEGAPAPDTATPLPLLAAVGAGLTVAGLLLKRR